MYRAREREGSSLFVLYSTCGCPVFLEPLVEKAVFSPIFQFLLLFVYVLVFFILFWSKTRWLSWDVVCMPVFLALVIQNQKYQELQTMSSV